VFLNSARPVFRFSVVDAQGGIGRIFRHRRNTAAVSGKQKGVSSMESTVAFDDIEFIETSAELLATSYYVNIQ
jgi:aspartate oxidase